jgi:hypothetical protein
MSYIFLSDEWLSEAANIRDELGLGNEATAGDIKLNVVVTGGPEGDREVHLANGNFGVGLLADAPTKMTVPFDVAKQVFIDGNQQAAMQAFMAGQIKVEGDMTKLMAMQSGAPSAGQQQMAERLKEITTV